MSHPVRKWLKDLLQYGRRNVQSPGDGRSPLLWAADLPRLGQMWLGHFWFRVWLDLRSTPPRVVYRPREVFSPYVWSYRTTQLNPIRPVRQAGELLTKVRRWCADGGLERTVAAVARLFAGGLREGLGILFFGAVGFVGATLVGAATAFSRSTNGLLGSLSTTGGAVGRTAQSAAGFVAEAGDRAVAAMTRFAGGFRSPREVAWTVATLTGTVGLILLMVLQVIGLPVTADNTVAAADPHVVHRPPMELAQFEPADDPFNGLPDPFATEPAGPPEVASDFGVDPFGPFPGDQAEPEPAPTPAPAADLDIEVVRTGPPEGIARFNLPDDQEQFVVTSSSAAPAVAGGTTFPPDNWLRAISQNAVGRPQIVPAAYRELVEHPLLTESPRQPSDLADRSVPAGRDLAISIRKTLPADAKAGELLWYELIVTNESGETIEDALIEERVEQPHRIADARPAAAFANGVLHWRFETLRPYEERRLSVAVFPMSDDPIVTSATARAVSTVAATTLVEAQVEPPISRPEPVEPRPEPIEPARQTEVRRIMIEMTTPALAASKSECVIQFAVTNTGTALLTGVAIDAVLPERLIHPDGVAVASTLGDLAPGETKRVELRATAGDAGETEIIAQVATAEGVATTVRGSFTIVESLAANTRVETPCCQPLTGEIIMLPVR